MSESKHLAAEGRVALVTGAGSGLGRAVALKLAQDRTDLYLVDINQENLAAVGAEAVEHGVRVGTQAVDLSVAENCAGVVQEAVAKLGRLDALCNVAGVMYLSHTTELPAELFQKTLAVNLAAPFHLIQAAIPHLLESKGAIVNVASAVGITAQAYNAAYCASKAGLIHMAKSLAMEFMNRGIRINAVAPGGMMTPLIQGVTRLEGADPVVAARTNPLRGLVDVDEVADMVAYLASDRARGYHGSCIVIDNGMSAG